MGSWGQSHAAFIGISRDHLGGFVAEPAAAWRAAEAVHAGQCRCSEPNLFNRQALEAASLSGSIEANSHYVQRTTSISDGIETTQRSSWCRDEASQSMGWQNVTGVLCQYLARRITVESCLSARSSCRQSRCIRPTSGASPRRDTRTTLPLARRLSSRSATVSSASAAASRRGVRRFPLERSSTAFTRRGRSCTRKRLPHWLGRARRS